MHVKCHTAASKHHNVYLRNRNALIYCVFTIEPRYGDAFKEYQEQQTHSTGRVVVEQFEHIEATLSREERTRSDHLVSRV